MPFWEKRKSAFVLAGLTAFHLLLISIQVPGRGQKSLLERAVFFVYSPVLRAAKGAIDGIGSIWSGYIDLRGVRAENRKLKQDLFFRNQEVRFLEDRLQFYRSEAQVKESLADFRGTIVTARVIGIDSANPFQSITIDKGRLDGIRRDMAVCDRFGCLVGRTIEPVSLKEAKVQLVTDKDSSVSVWSAAAGFVGSMRGKSSSDCELRNVLTSAPEAEIGEELTTTGFDRIYPPGIRVGTIAGVETDKVSPMFRLISVKPHFRLDTIDVVAVLTRGPGVGE